MYVYYVRWTVISGNDVYSGDGEYRRESFISSMEDITSVKDFIREGIRETGTEVQKDDVVLVDFYSLLRKE